MTTKLAHPWKVGQTVDLTAEQRDFQAATTARAAAVELEAHGWMQHDMGRPDGPKCAVAAVNFAMSGKCEAVTLTPEEEVVRDYLLREMERVINIPFISVVTWNDREGRTQDEVIAAFRATAERLHPQAGIIDA